MLTVTPAAIVGFIESFHGQSSTAGAEHPSKCAVVLEMLDRLDEKVFSDATAFASMRDAYARLEEHVERNKLNAGAASDIYGQWVSRGINPLRDIWQLMRTLPDLPPVVVSASDTVSPGLNKQKAVILTALQMEYRAVQGHLTQLREAIHPLGTVYGIGGFSGLGRPWEVALVEIGPGNPAAAVEAERAIRYFDPQVVLLVGVGGGVKDVALGDVVAATKVYGYESGKDRATFEPRPEVGHSTYRLEQRARAEAKKTDWLERIHQSTRPDASPRVFVGPIAAGSKVVASTRSGTYAFIRKHYGDALVVEMEGQGFLTAVHSNPGVEALVIRGVSDLIAGKSAADLAGFQEIASRNAAAFAFELLSKYSPPSSGVTQQYEESRAATHFEPDPRIEALIRPVGLGDWNRARDAALKILAETDRSGENELFDALLVYLDYPGEDDRLWRVLLTIESFAELAPQRFLDRRLLIRMAEHDNFSIRSSVAAICMTLAEFSHDSIPVDVLIRLASYDEDWYVKGPATAALKTMARHRPAIIHIFLAWLRSENPLEREHGAMTIGDIARQEPEILDADDLEHELKKLTEIGDETSANYIAEALSTAKGHKRQSTFKYGL